MKYTGKGKPTVIVGVSLLVLVCLLLTIGVSISDATSLSPDDKYNQFQVDTGNRADRFSWWTDPGMDQQFKQWHWYSMEDVSENNVDSLVSLKEPSEDKDDFDLLDLLAFLYEDPGTSGTGFGFAPKAGGYGGSQYSSAGGGGFNTTNMSNEAKDAGYFEDTGLSTGGAGKTDDEPVVQSNSKTFWQYVPSYTGDKKDGQHQVQKTNIASAGHVGSLNGPKNGNDDNKGGGGIGGPDTTTTGEGPYKTEGKQYIPDTQGSAVPEPGTMVLFGLGLLGLAGYGYRRKKNNA